MRIVGLTLALWLESSYHALVLATNFAEGDTFHIDLDVDKSVQYYGFAIDRVQCID